MLRFHTTTNAAEAKSYYTDGLTREDYYSEGQEIVGSWGGKGAERLKLSGQVDREAFAALCDQRNPLTGASLTPRRNEKRRVGYDLSWHCPKSVSVMYALTKDKSIMEAFQSSVHQTMLDIESEMKTRVRVGGKSEDRLTANMVWGEFIHLTARPVEGMPDPHLHAHTYVFNATWDQEEERWKAGQFGDLYRDAPYFEAVFHSHLAHGLKNAGYQITRGPKSWEISGVPISVIDKFSRRTALIEREAERNGIKNDRAKDKLGAATRENKRKGLTGAALRHDWEERLTEDEKAAIAAVAHEKGRMPSLARDVTARQALIHSLEHCYERESAVPERKILTHALKRGVGSVTLDQTRREVGSAISKGEVISEQIDGRSFCTTFQVLDEERRMVEFASQGRGVCRALNADRPPSPSLSKDQNEAARHILQSMDRVIVLRGRAGTGKTTLMKEVVEGVRESGKDILAFAPTAAASRGILRNEGFEKADTIAKLLSDESLQKSVKGQVIWIDEAGLVGSRTMKRVFEVAEQQGARVLLSGDTRQHRSVERGDALRLLEENAGLKMAELRQIQRQRGTYREAVTMISEGDIAKGFDRLEKLGAIRELSGDQLRQQLAADYIVSEKAGKRALVIAPTHREGGEVTAIIRERLKAEGKLGTDRYLETHRNLNLTEAERADAASYEAGQVVQFQFWSKGCPIGSRQMVSRIEDGKVFLAYGAEERELSLKDAAKFQVYQPESLPVAAGDLVRCTQNGKTRDGRHRLHNGSIHQIDSFTREGDVRLENGWIIGKSFGHLDHGYVSTSHAAQGRTVDRVIIAQSADTFMASNAQQFYVSVSRGRESVTVYTDDKIDLLRAISKDSVRPAAIDVGGLRAEERQSLFVNRLLREAALYARNRSEKILEEGRRLIAKYGRSGKIKTTNRDQQIVKETYHDGERGFQ